MYIHIYKYICMYTYMYIYLCMYLRVGFCEIRAIRNTQAAATNGCKWLKYYIMRRRVFNTHKYGLSCKYILTYVCASSIKIIIVKNMLFIFRNFIGGRSTLISPPGTISRKNRDTLTPIYIYSYIFMRKNTTERRGENRRAMKRQKETRVRATAL